MINNDFNNSKVREERTEKENKENASGTCAINNAASDPTDESNTGLLDKTGAI